MTAGSGLRAGGGKLLRRMRQLGGQRYCVLCSSHVRSFLPHGNPMRAQSVCPVCESRERHRLAWLYMSQRVFVDDRPRRVLHIAPEASIAPRLRALPGVEYVCGDIRAASGLRLDVHRLPFADAVFDFIYCSHVLNMVRDDRLALRELARVLRAGGTMLLQAPVTAEADTVEAAPAWGEAERLAEFGDAAMSRRYGCDVTMRMAGSGLQVQRLDFAGELDDTEFERCGLIREDLLICTHTGAGP